MAFSMRLTSTIGQDIEVNTSQESWAPVRLNVDRVTVRSRVEISIVTEVALNTALFSLTANYLSIANDQFPSKTRAKDKTEDSQSASELEGYQQ